MGIISTPIHIIRVGGTTLIWEIDKSIASKEVIQGKEDESRGLVHEIENKKNMSET